MSWLDLDIPPHELVISGYPWRRRTGTSVIRRVSPPPGCWSGLFALRMRRNRWPYHFNFLTKQRSSSDKLMIIILFVCFLVDLQRAEQSRASLAGLRTYGSCWIRIDCHDPSLVFKNVIS